MDDLVGSRRLPEIPESRELDFDRVWYPLGSGPSEFALDSDIGQYLYVSLSPKLSLI